MTSAAAELEYQASLVPPLNPQGRALAFIIVTVVGTAASWTLVGLRTWCRAVWLSDVWGLDDTLAILALFAYTVNSTYAILAGLYGLGTPDYLLDPFLPYTYRGLQYHVWWEVTYLIASALVKTSIGVAVIRIAIERRYRYTIYVLVIGSIAACLGGIIWELAACRPVASRWNPYVGDCTLPGIIVLGYAITVVTVITDAGYALVPILILRRLSMRRRVKYGLMVVLALGSFASIVSVMRYIFIKYSDEALPDYLFNNVWIPLLSEIELAIGLTSGSLPGIAKMFHFFDPKPTGRQGDENWAAPNTIGGGRSGRSPLVLQDLGSLAGSGNSRMCVSDNDSHSWRRSSVPKNKLSVVRLKGMWQMRSVH